MSGSVISLPEVDEVQITTITDNSLDVLMASTAVARRFPLQHDVFDHVLPVAEHGYSVLIRVKNGDRTGTVLFDTGVSRRGILWNFDALEIDAKEIGAIVLSHGHADHAMGFLPGHCTGYSAMNQIATALPEAFVPNSVGTTMIL